MPSVSDSSGLVAPLVVLSAVVVLYSLVISQQLLLGLIVILGVWFCYLLYRLVLRLGRIATALERLVEQRSDGEEWNERA